MRTTWSPALNRRDALRGIGATLGAGLLAGTPDAALAEPPPETTSVRLLYDPEVPILCYAPQYLAEEFLRLEGFTDIRYVGFGGWTSESQVLAADEVDITAVLGSDFIYAFDKGAPITLIGGIHSGCVEIFASDRVASIRDIGGKRCVATGPGGPEHVFISGVAALIGLNPATDIEWVWEPNYGNWPELLASGKADLVNAFPPQNLELRELGVGHVILNTTTDDPWRHFYCCMLAARSAFVQRYPVATKRVLRAFAKANQLCVNEPENTARRLVDWGATDRLDWALQTLDEVPYGSWRDYDPVDTVRFFGLRLVEAGLIGISPDELVARGTDFRFTYELQRELKT